MPIQSYDTSSNPPDVSVIVASFSSPSLLGDCLKSLNDQVGKPEVLVVSNRCDEDLADARDAYPLARFIQRPPNADVFELMSVGASEARGASILFIEDHATAIDQWIEEMTESLDQKRTVVGGPIDNGCKGLLGWALYLSEYYRYMPPMLPGPITSLCGANLGYDRQSLTSCKSIWEHSFRDNEVHDALKAQGITLWVNPKAKVISHLKMSMGQAISHLYRGGQHYGQYRANQSATAIWILRLLTCPAIPLVLFARLICNTLARRPGLLGILLLGAPLIQVLLGAWSVGEAVGYLRRGRPSVKRPLAET